MKLKKLALVICLLLCTLILVSCGTRLDKYDRYISELREDVLEAKNENYSVNVITGKKEDPFLMDGHCDATVDFTLITLLPTNKGVATDYTYEVVIDSVTYSGTFLPHPFGETYSADIRAKCTVSELDVIINYGGNAETLVAKSVKTTDMITSEKALEIAEKRLKSQIKSLKVSGELKAEIYVRLMSNPIDNSGGYYWYVAFVGEAQVTYAVLIHPVTMEIVAERD